MGVDWLTIHSGQEDIIATTGSGRPGVVVGTTVRVSVRAVGVWIKVWYSVVAATVTVWLTVWTVRDEARSIAAGFFEELQRI